MRFTVFTYIGHKEKENRFYSYAPYIREMNIWLQHVDEVEIVAPLSTGPILNSELAYKNNKINLFVIPAINLLNFESLFNALFNFPKIAFKIFRAMKRSDHIHLRCPGNIGLIACFIQLLFPKKSKTTKYAGNWDPEAPQPWSYKLQKWILSNTFLTRNMKVLVYGDWPDQSKNILPFFTASFSEDEKQKVEKDFSPPYKFLFVGNLVPGKQPHLAIQLVEGLNEKNIPAELHIYGDGILKNELEIHARNKDYIHLHGNRPFVVLKQAYKESHFLILASKSEGWPKAVAEAMFFGCIPIVTGVSCVPWMLDYGSRGILIPEGKVESGKWKVESQYVLDKVDNHPYGSGREVRGLRSQDSQNVLEETVNKIIELIKNPELMKRMSMEAQEWSQEYTLEKFDAEIKKLLSPQPPKGEQKNEL